MVPDSLDRITRQRKICPLRIPVLKKRCDGLARRIDNKLLGQQGLGGKMGKLVLRITVKSLVLVVPPVCELDSL